jgi:NADH-quinone oxidoreductase subunit C
MDYWGTRLVNKNNLFLMKTCYEVLGQKITSIHVHLNQLYITLREPKDILLVALFLRNNSDMQFDQLLDVWGVDNLDAQERFLVYYKLTSLKFSETIILRVSLKLNDEAYSLINLYSSANWLEREVWDMFGIIFLNHFDLRRILTDYGFLGFPLRKDFPLTGYLEVRYNLDLGKVISEPLVLTQEYRFFDFVSPWQPDFH